MTGQEPVYIAALAVNTASFIAAIIVVRTVPDPEPSSSANTHPVTGGILRAVTDLPYMAAALVNGLLGLHTAFLSFVIPLAMIQMDTSYAWIGPAAVGLHTVAIFFFQVRVSRSITNNTAAAWSFLASGVLIATAIGLLALLGDAAQGLPVLLSVLGVLVLIYAFGEMYSAAGGFEVAFGLAPRTAQGQYFGTFNALFHLGIALGPVTLGSLFFTDHIYGPLTLIGFFLFSGLIAIPLIRWADRHSRHNNPDT